MSTKLHFWSLTPKSYESELQPQETAIFNRLQAISQGSNHSAERQAIEDALASLRVLKRDNLGFPDGKRSEHSRGNVVEQSAGFADQNRHVLRL
jgi:hypothetical protein